MPQLGPPQSGLHCWQSDREDQVASRRVASFAQYGRPSLGSRITHSIEGWRTGELGGDTLPSEPEGWQRAMPCASG